MPLFATAEQRSEHKSVTLVGELSKNSLIQVKLTHQRKRPFLHGTLLNHSLNSNNEIISREVSSDHF